MKKVEAIVRHFKAEDVKNALAEKGITGTGSFRIVSITRLHWSKRLR